MRPSEFAPRRTALYPARLLCDERASIDCARVILGTSSSDSAVTPPAARRSISAAFSCGRRRHARTVPSRSPPASASDGGATLNTTSASPSSRPASGMTSTPTSS